MRGNNDNYIVLFINWKLIVLKLLRFEWDTDIGPILFLDIKNRRFSLCFCHRIKDRCIWFFGLEKYLCSRCLGIFIGWFIGLFLVLCQYQIWTIWSIILMLPLIIDGFLQALLYRESNNLVRLTTGFLFGIGLQFFLAMIVESLKMNFFIWTQWKKCILNWALSKSIKMCLISLSRHFHAATFPFFEIAFEKVL